MGPMPQRPACPTALRPQSVLLWLAAILGLVAAGCGDLPEPELGSPPSSITDEVDLTSPTGGAGTVIEAPDGVVDDSPPRPDGYVAELLASTGTTVLAGPIDAYQPLGEPISTVNVVRVVDDYFGGIVVQAAGGRVLWFAGEAAQPEVIASEAEDETSAGGTLLDVGFSEGTPEAVLSIGGGVLERVQLVTGERNPLIALPEGQAMVDLSASNGIFALTYRDAECGGILLFTSTGEPVDIETPADTECQVPARPTFDEIAFGPEGDVYVYTEVAYRADGVESSTTLIARELSSRSELFRLPVGEAGDRIDSLAFDGRRVLFVRSSLNEEASTGLTVIDVTTPDAPRPVGPAESADEPQVLTSVSFARRPLTVLPTSEG